ncbi:class I SAM-dependent rRNA methyltransferase [Anaerocolumna sp. AGMB13025]|uniref:class I SAM-dependent rRNA methyltransferase n=1 Tax=Anaerocolumna sp. AGMB13025 TaxID=3039116 RepID=UPI00241F34D8|nr:class I SAM-dependent rRNA methyltransferase [Anaerocolumna sp. AGMB13025]WFR59610.1 class I SAM-dependent rRNA methyltransferase [Anaerocolumna sp. AGMB13025]
MEKAIVKLKKGEGRTLKAGGMWVYDNEIDSISGDFTDGDIIVVHDFDDYYMGSGFINTRSKITVRIMSRIKGQEIDNAFLENRVKAAWEYRKKTVDTSSCRIIFGEADFLPGIVIDKFNDVLVVQSLALGIDRMKEQIVELLKCCLKEEGIIIRGVYERSDAKVRSNEGMERIKGFIGEPFDTKVEITENGVKYLVDVEDGQKTGFFLDQKYNREAIKKLCKDAEVLDCFTHTGSFALNAGLAGAKSVTGVDASELGIKQANENARLNGLQDTVHFMCTDVFELLPELERQNKKFDVIILDPPAFTKSRNSIKNAVKGYREINLRAMKLIKNGGYLATCSCSHFMTPELFAETIGQAAKNTRKRLRQVEYRTQSPDHPILWAADESYYLKFFIFQVCEER